jgi:hypothetical protein
MQTLQVTQRSMRLLGSITRIASSVPISTATTIELTIYQQYGHMTAFSKHPFALLTPNKQLLPGEDVELNSSPVLPA